MAKLQSIDKTPGIFVLMEKTLNTGYGSTSGHTINVTNGTISDTMLSFALAYWLKQARFHKHQDLGILCLAIGGVVLNKNNSICQNTFLGKQNIYPHSSYVNCLVVSLKVIKIRML